MRKLVWVFATTTMFAIAVSFLAQKAQPGPEAKKMSMFAGTWTYTGEAKATPLGPAAKINGKQTGRVTGEGFGFENNGQEMGPFGGINWSETDVYDPGSKTYRYLGYQSDGSVWQGTGTNSGNVWQYSGTMTVKGTSYSVRTEATFAADGKSFVWKAEVSTDGKTWMPWSETKTVKTSS